MSASSACVARGPPPLHEDLVRVQRRAFAHAEAAVAVSEAGGGGGAAVLAGAWPRTDPAGAAESGEELRDGRVAVEEAVPPIACACVSDVWCFVRVCGCFEH